MVYLNLSVLSKNSSVDFYVNKLGFFDYIAGRLICNMGVDLIIDLLECGTEEHLFCFNSMGQVQSSFWIHVGNDSNNMKIEVIDHLVRHAVIFENESNLGGHCLGFVDPSGNKFKLHANLGVFK